jgi:hypothetical protein
METRRVSDLSLSEYAVVPTSVDTPGHFEFNARIPESILQKRTGWTDYSYGDGLPEANRQLAPFGYRLVLNQDSQGNKTFDLFHGNNLVKGSLSLFYPVSAYQDEQGNGDFALVVENAQGDWLVRKENIEVWDMMLHRYTRPVFAGSRLITVERDLSASLGMTDRVIVKQDGQPIFTYSLASSPVEEVVKTLGEWNGSWVLEVNGTLIVDGAIYNLKDFQTDELFNWMMLDGKPFFFFRRNGKTSAWYDGKELPVQYDEIIHGRCCEPAAFNVITSPEALWFYASRDGIWYIAELGTHAIK